MRVTRRERNAKYLAHLRHSKVLEVVGGIFFDKPCSMVYDLSFGSEILVASAALSVASSSITTNARAPHNHISDTKCSASDSGGRGARGVLVRDPHACRSNASFMFSLLKNRISRIVGALQLKGSLSK